MLNHVIFNSLSGSIHKNAVKSMEARSANLASLQEFIFLHFLIILLNNLEEQSTSAQIERIFVLSVYFQQIRMSYKLNHFVLLRIPCSLVGRPFQKKFAIPAYSLFRLHGLPFLSNIFCFSFQSEPRQLEDLGEMKLMQEAYLCRSARRSGAVP
jgi:hypothetical protein